MNEVKDFAVDCRYCNTAPNVTSFPIKEDERVRWRVTIECKSPLCRVHPMIEAESKGEAVTLWNAQQLVEISSVVG